MGTLTPAPHPGAGEPALNPQSDSWGCVQTTSALLPPFLFYAVAESSKPAAPHRERWVGWNQQLPFLIQFRSSTSPERPKETSCLGTAITCKPACTHHSAQSCVMSETRARRLQTIPRVSTPTHIFLHLRWFPGVVDRNPLCLSLSSWAPFSIAQPLLGIRGQ